MYFDSDKKEIRSGNSGAPIINKNECVISILSAALFQVKENGKDHVDKSSIFSGAKPETVAEFVDNFLFAPDFFNQP